MNDIENIEEEKIKFIGTKIYYCNITGNVLIINGDACGFVRETSFDEDYEIYKELKEREKNTIGLIEVEYGKYGDLSKGSTGVKVNLETKQLEFTQEPLPEVPQEPSMESRIETIEETILNLL